MAIQWDCKPVSGCLMGVQQEQVLISRKPILRSRGQALPETGNRPESKCLRDVKVLTAFLEREIEKGRLSLGDPNTMALILLGSLMNYVFLEQMNPKAGITTAAPIFIQNIVEILWQGIAPTQD